MSQIVDLVDELKALREAEWTLGGHGESLRSRLFPPATEDAICGFEEKAGLHYPASFREFLSLSNGWRNFWPDWSLVGVPRDDAKDFYTDIAATLDVIP